MKIAVVVFFCTLAVTTGAQHCYKMAQEACDLNNDKEVLPDCSAKYGQATKQHMRSVIDYANMHIKHSFQYLLMSSHFANYQKAREGFEKLYRKLSDTAWEDAIHLIKYVTLRGEAMDLEPYYDLPREGHNLLEKEVVEMNEFESLAKAVDIQKKLAEEAHRIYKAANPHDPELGSFVQDTFMHRHAKTVRELVGYTNDLKSLIHVDSPSKSVGVPVFLLDEYLQKHL